MRNFVYIQIIIYRVEYYSQDTVNAKWKLNTNSNNSFLTGVVSITTIWELEKKEESLIEYPRSCS